MSSYQYSLLDHSEFENLATDYIEHRLQIKLERFREGRDGGIDSRYTTDWKDPEIIVQAKRYAGYSNLKSILKKELNKIQILKPKRYIIVTSVSLSALNKKEIKSILGSYLLTPRDIITKDDLDAFIEFTPKILHKYFKLWLTNLTLLQTFLNQGINNQSKTLLQEMAKELPRFIETADFQRALSTLQKHKVILITGAPGIGKTTLAKQLGHFALAELDAQLSLVYDFEQAFQTLNPEVPQVIMLDDYLGSNYLEVVNADQKIAGHKIIDFVQSIQNSEHHYLILTSRTVIQTQAYKYSEKLRRNQEKLHEFELKIEDLTELDRARIFVSHLRFNNTPQDHIDDLCLLVQKKERYFEIINHEHYNPRLIEFITSPEKLPDDSSTYYSFCLHHLKHPFELWDGAYQNAITEPAQIVLQCLFLLGDFPSEVNLQKAYQSRMKFEGLRYSFPDQITTLIRGFLVRYLDADNKAHYRFINPSLNDFFLRIFNEDAELLKTAIKSANQVKILTYRFKVSGNFKKIFETDFSVKSTLIEQIRILGENAPPEEISKFLDIFWIRLNAQETMDVVLPLLQKTIHDQTLEYELSYLCEWAIEEAEFKEWSFINKAILVPFLLRNYNFAGEYKTLPKLLAVIFQKNYDELLLDEDVNKILVDHFNRFWDQNLVEVAQECLSYSDYELEVDEDGQASMGYDEVSEVQEIADFLNIPAPDASVDLAQVFEGEIHEQLKAEYDADRYEDEWRENRGQLTPTPRDSNEIRDLFSTLK